MDINKAKKMLNQAQNAVNNRDYQTATIIGEYLKYRALKSVHDMKLSRDQVKELSNIALASDDLAPKRVK